MIQTYRNSLKIFWGNKQHEISMQDIKQARYSSSLQLILTALNLQRLVILKQVHGSQGLLVQEHQQPLSLFDSQGDFLITNLKRCGLVVLTADCAPVILYDQRLRLAGAVHSGWKGSAQGVILQALKVMQQQGTQLEDIKIFFGASAKTCCYEVGADFEKEFEKYSYAHKAFIKRNNTLYFDNELFIKLQLKAYGVDQKNIDSQDEICTICHTGYASFRREKEQAGRQATVVTLI